MGADRRGGHVIRDWARQDPQRDFLIYGTPVPGYHAPGDTTAISHEVMAVLIDACGEQGSGGPETAFDGHLADHREWAGGDPAPTVVLHRALSFWTRLHGVLSLEPAGHFAGMRFDPGLLIDEEVVALARSAVTG